MQEMNCIQLSRPDYPTTGSSAIFPTPAPGLQNRRAIAPVIVAAKGDYVLSYYSVAEDNLARAGEKAETIVDNQFALKT